MNDIALSSLRVAADIDASKYKIGADQKVASDRAMVASSQAVGAAFSQTDTKISTAGDSLAKLSRQYLDGYKNQERFEQGLRQIGRQLDSGKTDIDGATRLLVGMNQKLGLTADVSELAAKGQTQLAAAAGMANTQIEAQTVALQQAAVAHAALIAQARADQASDNSRQIAAANQGAVNSTLGVRAPTSATPSGSVFEAEFARLDDIARLRAQQAGATFADEFNSSVMATSGKSARASASVFEEAGREADQMASRVAALRAELNPLAAAQDRVNAELAEYSALAAKGAISADELAQAQTLARNRAAANQNMGFGRPGGMNAAYQIQDIAMMSALGQAPLAVGLQQGPQLAMAMAEGGGVKALGTGLASLINPTMLLTVGLTAATAAAVQFFTSGGDKSKALETSLQNNVKSINALTDAYHMAGVSAEELERKSIAASEAGERRSEKELEAQIRLEQKRFTASTKPTDLMTFGMLGDNRFDVAPEFAAFTDPIRKLREEIDAQAKGEGKANFDAFFQSIDKIANTGPGAFTGFVDELVRSTGIKVETYSDIRDRLYEMGGEARQAARQLELVLEVQRKIDQENTRAGLQDQRGLNRYVGARNIQEGREREQFDASQQMERARTNAERLAAVEAQERARYPSQADEGGGLAARVDRARQQELQRQQLELKDAQDQRRRSLDQTLASAKLDVDLIGQTTSAVEGLRLAAQLESQVREEAARKGVAADEAEIARIKAKAIEYGKVRALQEARDTIHNQEMDLETQRSELGLVGENTLARQRSAAALKTEQDIRKLGIPLYGQEANAMRANTAALSENAEAMARASLQADLLFERSQILRNSDDQQIASKLQSAGLPIDLNSAEAGMMRYNMALSEAKDNFKSFASDMAQGLREGKSLWDSFKDAGINALSKLADKLIDRGTDGIFNALFGGEKAGGGLLGDLLSGNGSQSGTGAQSTGASSLLGKLFGGAGGQSVGSMQVQAASVFVNGAPVGLPGVGSLGSLLGGSSFRADTTLSDILGYGGGDAANQNVIQSRIDQAFGTGGSAQDLIQSRIDQAFGTTFGGLGGIFSPAGMTGGGLTGSMSSYASAIKMIESAGSGGYSALGPVLKNGDQALGAYQVMRSNLPSWSTEAFGKPMSQSAFMSNPAAQDAIFSQQFGKSLSKYGNPSDAASVWFTGGPLSTGKGKSDVLGTTGSKYVDMFDDNLKKLGGSASQATNALGNLGGASEGLISQFSKMGQSLLSQLTPATSSSSWFQGLSGMFGGSSGALGFMNSISPKATGDILSGSWGLFADGTENAPSGWAWVGERGPELRKLRAGDVIRSNPRSMEMAANQSGAPAANDRPAQAIHQTNNFIFRENPATPASQNQIAAKSARALERLQRTA